MAAFERQHQPESVGHQNVMKQLSQFVIAGGGPVLPNGSD